MTQWFDTKEAASYVKLKPSTLERKRLDSTGPPYKKVGRGKNCRVLYSQQAIDLWLEQFSYNSTSEYETD